MVAALLRNGPVSLRDKTHIIPPSAPPHLSVLYRDDSGKYLNAVYSRTNRATTFRGEKVRIYEYEKSETP